MTDSVAEALQRLADASPLLVALDFDGTLAPTVDRPEDARAVPEAVEAIEALLALPDVRVALVSGRAVDSLSAVAPPREGLLLVGSHGAEVVTERGVELDLTDDDRGVLADLRALVGESIAGVDGAWTEEKPAGLAVHTRLVTAGAAAPLVSRTREAVASRLPSVHVRDGKDIVEFSVKTTTKGDGIERLRAMTDAAAVLYAGDDVTDEDAFAALGPADVGVKVGEGDTAAALRVADAGETAALLHRLAELRRTRVFPA